MELADQGKPWIRVSTTTPGSAIAKNPVNLLFKAAIPVLVMVVLLLPTLMRPGGSVILVSGVILGLLALPVVFFVGLKIIPNRIKQLHGDELWRQFAAQGMNAGVLTLRPAELTWRASRFAPDQTSPWSTDLRSITNITLERRPGKLGVQGDTRVIVTTQAATSSPFSLTPAGADGLVAALRKLGAVAD